MVMTTIAREVRSVAVLTVAWDWETTCTWKWIYRK